MGTTKSPVDVLATLSTVRVFLEHEGFYITEPDAAVDFEVVGARIGLLMDLQKACAAAEAKGWRFAPPIDAAMRALEQQ